MKCESCAFWKRNEVVVGEPNDFDIAIVMGECRRYPPKVWVFGIDDDGKPISGESVPERPADWWCGEYLQPDILAERQRGLPMRRRTYEGK